MRLADWQESFIDALGSDGNDAGLLNFVKARESRRLAIYRNNSYQALLACLQANFPICGAVLGEDCFARLAGCYVGETPMCSSNLNEYGADFPALLAREIDAHEAFAGLEYLPDLALLEWLLRLSYYAADDAGAQALSALADLNERQQQDVVLVLRPDICLLTSGYPLYEIWLRHQDEHRDAGGSVPIDAPGERYYLAVYRQRFKARVARLSAEEYRLLSAVAAGAGLGKLSEQASNQALLPDFIGRGWVCGFRLVQGDS